MYVFAVTQLSHLVIDHRLSVASIAQAPFPLLVLWWAWIYTTWMVNWFDPGSVPVRLALVAVGLAGLLMSAAIPTAFSTSAPLFAIASVVLQVGRNLAGALLLDRAQAFIIIIALGESIVVTGATASTLGLTAATVAALAVAFLGTGALWWLSFGEVAEHSRRHLAASDDPGRLARDAWPSC